MSLEYFMLSSQDSRVLISVLFWGTGGVVYAEIRDAILTGAYFLLSSFFSSSFWGFGSPSSIVVTWVGLFLGDSLFGDYFFSSFWGTPLGASTIDTCFVGASNNTGFVLVTTVAAVLSFASILVASPGGMSLSLIFSTYVGFLAFAWASLILVLAFMAFLMLSISSTYFARSSSESFPPASSSSTWFLLCTVTRAASF